VELKDSLEATLHDPAKIFVLVTAIDRSLLAVGVQRSDSDWTGLINTTPFERSRWRGRRFAWSEPAALFIEPRMHANARESSQFVYDAFPLHARSAEVNEQCQMQS
jgi:hypothetical protein